MSHSLFTNHAAERLAEYYGDVLTMDEQFAALRRIRKGGGAQLKRRGKDKYPTVLVSWDRMRALIAVVLSPDLKRVVTVLSPECDEVQRAWRKWFG